MALSAHPNGFNLLTTVTYDVPADAQVDLRINDLTGRKVVDLVDEHQTAGRYEIVFDGRSCPSGVHLAILQSGRQRVSHKILMAK